MARRLGTTAGEPIRVGLVTDIGGLDDRSFNFLANRGLARAEDELGVEGRVVISKAEADYVPNLTSLAKQDYDLEIAVGFLMANAVDTVAARYKDVSY
ncbi:MAG: BMP family ABC transporter substrate-binding protein, partial [Thermoleophilia bacterium]|nr:BMP family ABC transporter substrate-binding protein [Thermoleophilia bacterium]